MPAALELAGKRFGRLVVLCRATVPGSRNAVWRCQCDCGNTTLGAAGNLGKTKFSCGCLASEVHTATLNINRLARRHLHGMSRTPEWSVWSAMKDRCLNPRNVRYPRYGGRGIKVCKRWLTSFENFISDMGLRPSKRHSIDRIDNDKNYEPRNCHWALNKTQSRNRSTNLRIEIKGITLCVEEWCETLGIPRWKPYEMIRKGGRTRDLPAKFKTIESAIRFLHANKSS